MPDDPAVIVIAEALLRLKRRIMPQGSRRARAARWLMAPLLGRLRERAAQAARQAPPPPVSVLRWEGPALAARGLPARPRILVLVFGHLGDFVVSLPALECLRNGFPDAEITLVCGPPYLPWVKRLDWSFKVVPFNIFTDASADWKGMTEERIASFSALELGSFDLAVDLRHDHDTRVLLGLVETRFRAGFRTPPGHGPQLDLALPDCSFAFQPDAPPSLHSELRLLMLAQATVSMFGLRPPHPALRLVRSASVPERRYAVVCPGAGAETRVWPLTRLIEICRALVTDHDLDIDVIGGPREAAAAARLAAALPPGRVHDRIGTLPLAELSDLMVGATLYLGYDTGPTHLAASLGVPTICVFAGVGQIDVWHPLGDRVTVIAGQTSCSPCNLIHDTDCPYGVVCREEITAPMVLDACRMALRAEPSELRKQDA